MRKITPIEFISVLLIVVSILLSVLAIIYGIEDMDIRVYSPTPYNTRIEPSVYYDEALTIPAIISGSLGFILSLVSFKDVGDNLAKFIRVIISIASVIISIILLTV